MSILYFDCMVRDHFGVENQSATLVLCLWYSCMCVIIFNLRNFIRYTLISDTSLSPPAHYARSGLWRLMKDVSISDYFAL